MKKYKISTIIRFVLTLPLIYAVYTETGIFTTICIFLIFNGIEISSYLLIKHLREIRELLK